jgi:hypothetical protein
LRVTEGAEKTCVTLKSKKHKKTSNKQFVRAYGYTLLADVLRLFASCLSDCHYTIILKENICGQICNMCIMIKNMCIGKAVKVLFERGYVSYEAKYVRTYNKYVCLDKGYVLIDNKYVQLDRQYVRSEGKYVRFNIGLVG